MENERALDLGELKRNIDEAELVTIYFPFLRKTLLIDNRVSSVDPPMVKVVPMVQNSEERLRSLRKLRPRFGRPQSIVFVPWTHRIASFASLGVLDYLQRHFAELGWAEAARQCREAYGELEQLEREQIRNAVLGGDNFETLWAADPDAVE